MRLIATLLLLVLFAAVSAPAQTTSQQMSGIVKDASADEIAREIVEWIAGD